MAWLRLYDDIVDDPKMDQLSGDQFRLWITIMCMANRSPVRGQLLIAVHPRVVPVSEQSFVRRTGLTAKEIDGAFDLFELLDLLHRDKDGIWCVSNWNQTQVTIARPPLSEWRVLRETVFARDDYTCQYCDQRGVRLECDHIVPVIQGGQSGLENLATACTKCNRKKHGRTPEQAGMRLLREVIRWHADAI